MQPVAVRTKTLSAKITANAPAHPVNPLVTRAFADQTPASMQDVAERYGRIFEAADQRWQASPQNPAESMTLAESDEDSLCQV